MILAYDVTGDATVISWRCQGGEKGELATRAPKATSALLPAIQRLLTEKDVLLERLAVIRGPGSFTGIRVGLATALGLRLSLNVPVFAFSKFELMAAQVGVRNGTLLLPARGGDVFSAELRDGRVQAPHGPRPASDFSAAGNCYGVHPINGLRLTSLRSDFTGICLDLLERGEPAERTRRLEPLYIRPPDAKINLTLLQKLRDAVPPGDDNQLPIC